MEISSAIVVYIRDWFLLPVYSYSWNCLSTFFIYKKTVKNFLKTFFTSTGMQ